MVVVRGSEFSFAGEIEQGPAVILSETKTYFSRKLGYRVLMASIRISLRLSSQVLHVGLRILGDVNHTYQA
jgi:hypothetical protein